MTKPIPVTITQPYRTPGEKVSDIVAQFIVLAIRAWIVMLLVPYAFNIEPSYWQTAAAILAFGNFFGLKDNHTSWSRLGKKEDI